MTVTLPECRMTGPEMKNEVQITERTLMTTVEKISR
jgi:hypothetical protein